MKSLETENKKGHECLCLIMAMIFSLEDQINDVM